MIVVESKGGYEPLTRPVPIRDGEARLSKATVRRLVREGRLDELAGYGVHVAERAEPPDGKQPVADSQEIIVERDGRPVLVHEAYEDRPVPPPPPEPEPDTRTVEEKIADAAGITLEEARAWRDGETKEAVAR